MRIDVVIVTLNDPRIERCVSSVLAQQGPHDFTITVVDGDSTDGSREALEKRFRGDPRVRVIIDPRPFLEAWNAGMVRGDAPIVVRLDSDTVARPDWLTKLIAPLEREPALGWTAGMVVGPTPPRSRTQAYVHHRAIAWLQGLTRPGADIAAVPSWNVAYRRAALVATGGFDERLVSSEDWDLHHRMQLKGFPGRMVPDAILEHDHPARLRTLLRKEFWYKQGQMQLARKWGLRRVADALKPIAAYFTVLLLFALSAVHWATAVLGAGLFLTLAVKQSVEAAREGDPNPWLRPVFRFLEAVWGAAGLMRGLFLPRATKGIR